MTSIREYPVKLWEKDLKSVRSQKIIEEEPLSIRVQGKPYAVVMRTPGEEIPHVAGFSFTEGLVDNPDEFESLSFCDGSDTNVVTVTLKPSRREKISQHLNRRSFISQTSCGICGKEIIKDLESAISPLKNEVQLEMKAAYDRLENLSDFQPLRYETRAAHAAAIFDKDFKLLSVAEDIGRHNALDKAIGKLFLENQLSSVAFLILSSRISYELVQKSARAAIPIILAISRPTSLAVSLGSGLNMTIACQSEEGGLYIFCGSHRLI